VHFSKSIPDNSKSAKHVESSPVPSLDEGSNPSGSTNFFPANAGKKKTPKKPQARLKGFLGVFF